MHIQLMGRLRSAMNADKLFLDKHQLFAHQLIPEIILAYPELASALNDKGIKIAVNQCFVNQDHELNTADEIALLPPVSGG